MTHANDSTMAASEATDPPFKTIVHPNKSKRLKAMLVLQNLIERTHLFMIWVYFLPRQANMKFNPITSHQHVLLFQWTT